jgi:hypothetical protein
MDMQTTTEGFTWQGYTAARHVECARYERKRARAEAPAKFREETRAKPRVSPGPMKTR